MRLKILLIVLFLLWFGIISGFSAPTLLSTSILPSGKIAFTAASDVLVISNNYLDLPSAGFRVGTHMFGELGIRGFYHGAVLDLKYPFFSVYPFSTAVDFEWGYTGQSEFAASFLLQLEVVSFMHLGLSARLRYPALNSLDTAAAPQTGAAFYTTAGLEFFRSQMVSFMISASMVKSWNNGELSPVYQAMITVKP